MTPAEIAAMLAQVALIQQKLAAHPLNTPKEKQ